MMTLKEWMELVDYRITEGGEYSWYCYGEMVHQLSSWNGIHGDGGWSSNIIFSREDQTVFEVEFCDYTNNRAYRLLNPGTVNDYKKEAEERNSPPDLAWDGVDYVDLEVVDDFIQKALAIKAGENYDTRVSVPLEISDEDLLTYMKAAHERDMTFNEFVEEAIRQAIKDYESDPEGSRARAKAWTESQDC